MLRHDEFLLEILEGRMTVKPTRGMKRIQSLNDLVDKDYTSLMRKVEDRIDLCGVQQTEETCSRL